LSETVSVLLHQLLGKMEASSLWDRKGAHNVLNDVALGGGEGAVDVMESKKF
jgi:hypothetical protein